MSDIIGGRSRRLQAVGRSESRDRPREIPVEVLSFAILPSQRRELLLQVSDLLDQIRFGTVVMVLHDCEVTQIEASEKIRLPTAPAEDGTS